MKTTKNKTIKGIKILASGPLYYALLVVPAVSSCLRTEEKITAIKLPPSAKKPVIINAGSDVLKQLNTEEVYALPRKRPKVGVESNNETNQISVPVENSEPKSTNRSNGQPKQDVNSQSQMTPNASNRNTNNRSNGQPKQNVNSQSQMTPSASNRNTKEGNDTPLDHAREKGKRLNERPSHLNASMPLPENGTKQEIPLDRDLQPLLSELQANSEKIERMKDRWEDKQLKNINYVRDQLDKLKPPIDQKILNLNKKEQKEYIKGLLRMQESIIEKF